MSTTSANSASRQSCQCRSHSEIARAADLGLTPTAALTVFMKRFVAEGGFPFDVRKTTPSKEEFTAEMEARYERMLAGHETEHDLIEV